MSARSKRQRKSLRILFLTEYYPPAVHGGGELSCAALAQHLAETGVHITVLTSSAPGMPERQQQGGVTVIRRLRTGRAPGSIRSNLWRALRFRHSLLRETRRLLRAESFDAVHCFNMTTIPAIALRREAGIPFLAHVNSLLFACPKGDLLYHGKSLCKIHCDYTTFVPCLRDSTEIGKLRNSPLISYNPLALSSIYARYFNLKRLLPAFDQVIAISSFLKTRLAFVGVPKGKISVLHNIVDLSRFQPRAAALAKRKTLRLLFIGTLSAAKGIPELLTALEGLPGDWQCDLYGAGQLRSLVQRLADRDRRILLHAPVPDAQLPRLYQRADIVLFPSRWPEPFGRIALEAMAAGKPLLTTRTGGILDTVTAETAVLVPPGDARALRNAIHRLMQSPAKCQRMGKAGISHVRAHFAPKHLTVQMLQIYRKVL